MRTIYLSYFLASCAWLCGSLLDHLRADDGIAFFEQKIRPVLIEHCYSCHSAEAKSLKGNLYLDSKSGWERGGDSGQAVVVPGKPDASLLIRCVQHLERDLAMPPMKPKLPAVVIADLTRWVELGAPDPRDGKKVDALRGDKSWWSLQPLVKGFKHDTIDGFIAEKLAELKLKMNPPADARSLIRRMSYDVTGLPPTLEDVERFSKEHQTHPSEAIEALVDRLLNSPRYGERWGRHWLDTIRFGESKGFERNVIIDDLWPFRDYVIKSINDDKPFNQFIIEHIAGDVIGKDKPEVDVGSSFLVAGPYDDVGNQDVIAQKNIRAATLDEMITAVSGAFLGLTINCARCHNHKFDPIPTEDYYRLRAAFEGVTHGSRIIASKEEKAAFAASNEPLLAELKVIEAERGALDRTIDDRAKVAFAKFAPDRPKIDPRGTDETFPATEAKYLQFVVTGLTSEPNAKGKRLSAQGGKLTEFQVWSVDAPKYNVALTAHGTKAEGAKSTSAEDFPEAYGPQYCIDGTLGEAWFIGEPPILTLTFPKIESINRITFINARGENGAEEGQSRGATPCNYEVRVSLDGENWRSVASDEGRQPWTAEHGIALARLEVITAEDREKLELLDKRAAEIQAKQNALPKLPQVWAGNFAQPKDSTFVHKGGDPMKPGEAVLPASLSVLDQVMGRFELKSDAEEGERRLALAKWIADSQNPLTARVLANRVWQHHFGNGVVDSPSDFGFLGSKPTHPELLDFLAVRLISFGWKLKALHREILLSQAYQQSSTYRDDAAQTDKDARLLWRFPPRRLSAEEIRDSMLSLAGKLKLEPMGGPGFRLYKFTQNNVCTYFPLDNHGPETYRRAVYHQNARASVVDVLSDFDLPNIAFAAPTRTNTTTPLQSLTLLNHNFTLDMAQAFASRLMAEDPVGQAYGIAFQRAPAAKEYEAAAKLVNTHGVAAMCRALFNANELIYLD